MRKLPLILCACLALGLVAGACGDDDDEGSGNGGAARTAEEPRTEGSAANAGVGKVSMQDVEFEPETVRVPPGSEVTWTNDDSVAHDVTAADDSFKSGSPAGMSPGDTFTHRFREAGTFKYECTVHPGMEGTVRVR
jgi:plastocyanin